MNSLFNTVRHKVSADKNRYKNGTFDLDLTYITDRIVAMAYPAEGMEAAYRNNIDHVAALLQKQHPNHFMLYNLSNRDYDFTKFGKDRVSNWCGFPDHHPPPLALLFRIVHSIQEFLDEDEENVAVIHCLAGKGRTGTVIASYFLYCGLMPTIEDALNFFSYRRSVNSWGVTGPSQLRYLGYFEHILRNDFIPHTKTMKIIQVSFEPVPQFTIGGGEKGCSPFFEIYKLNRDKQLLYSSESMSEDIQSFSTNRDPSVTFFTDCIVHGDIIIHFKHCTPLHGAESMFHFGFNVGMVQGNTVITMRHQIEKAEKDNRFPNSFRTVVVMEPYTESTNYDLPKTEKEAQRELFSKRLPKHLRDGTICFRGNSLQRKLSLIEIARDIGCPMKGSYTVKGGYLLIIDRKTLSTKRRWFLLKGSTFSFHKGPRELKAIGSISIGSLYLMRIVDNIVDYPYCFKIETDSAHLLLAAPSRNALEYWVKAIAYTRDLFHLKRENSVHQIIGTLQIHIGECKIPSLSGELCCTLRLEDQTFTSIITKDISSDKNSNLLLNFDDHYTFFLEHEESSLYITLSERPVNGIGRTIGIYSIPLIETKNPDYASRWITFFSDEEKKQEEEEEEEEKTEELILDQEYNDKDKKYSDSEGMDADNEDTDYEDKKDEGEEQEGENEDENEKINISINILDSNEDFSIKEDSSESSDNNVPKLHISIQYSEIKPEELRNAETELVFTPEVIPVSPSRDSSRETSPIITRLRTYDKDQTPYSTTCPNFVSLPSEYKWINGPTVTQKPSPLKHSQSTTFSSIPIPDNTGPFELNITRRFESRLNEISCTCFVKEHLWTGDSRGNIHVWDKLKGQQLMCIKAHQQKVCSMVVAAGKVWSSSTSEVCVWSQSKPEKIKKFQLESEYGWKLARIHTNEVNQVWVFSEDPSGTTSKMIVWDATSLDIKKRFQLRTSSIGCIVEHQASVWVGALNFIIRYNPITFKRESVMKVGLGMINAMVFDEMRLWVTSAFASRICVWDTEMEEQLCTLSEHTDRILTMVKVDNRYLLSSGLDCNIIVWDLNTCKFVSSVPSTHTEPISQLLLDPLRHSVISLSPRLLVYWDCFSPI